MKPCGRLTCFAMRKLWKLIAVCLCASSLHCLETDGENLRKELIRLFVNNPEMRDKGSLDREVRVWDKIDVPDAIKRTIIGELIDQSVVQATKVNGAAHRTARLYISNNGGIRFRCDIRSTVGIERDTASIFLDKVLTAGYPRVIVELRDGALSFCAASGDSKLELTYGARRETSGPIVILWESGPNIWEEANGEVVPRDRK